MALTAIHVRTSPILFDIERAALSRTLLCHAPYPTLRGAGRYGSRVTIVVAITAVIVMPGDPVIEARTAPAGFARDHGAEVGPVDLTVITRETRPIARMRLALLAVRKLLESDWKCERTEHGGNLDGLPLEIVQPDQVPDLVFVQVSLTVQALQTGPLAVSLQLGLDMVRDAGPTHCALMITCSHRLRPGELYARHATSATLHPPPENQTQR